MEVLSSNTNSTVNNGSGAAAISSPTVVSRDRTPATAQQVIRENVQFLIEQLEAGHSEALTAYLNAVAHFHNYSFGNVLLIARQRAVA